MEINTGMQSTAVVRTIIEGKERSFCFPERTNTDAIKEHIITAAKKRKLEVNEKDIYYVGNKLIGIGANLDSPITITNYLDSLVREKEKNNGQNNKAPERKYREWNFSFSDIIEKSHRSR